MESLSKSFFHAHGTRLKIAFAQSLVQLLHPIGKVRISCPLLETVTDILVSDSPGRSQSPWVGEGDRSYLPQGARDAHKTPVFWRCVSAGHIRALRCPSGLFRKKLDVVR
jgi:hypothetical protein